MHIGKYSSLLLVPLLVVFLSGCEVESGGGLSSLIGGSDGSSGTIGEGGSSGGSSGSAILLVSTSGDGGGSSIDTDPPAPLGPPVLTRGDDNITPVVNPEPGSLLLFGSGLLGPFLSRSRLRQLFRKRKKA